MNYHVEWTQTALDELMTGWMRVDSATRKLVTDASQTAEQILAKNPHGEGESRGDGSRFIFVEPLAITFRVERDDRTVTISHVRVHTRRG